MRAFSPLISRSSPASRRSSRSLSNIRCNAAWMLGYFIAARFANFACRFGRSSGHRLEPVAIRLHTVGCRRALEGSRSRSPRCDSVFNMFDEDACIPQWNKRHSARELQARRGTGRAVFRLSRTIAGEVGLSPAMPRHQQGATLIAASGEPRPASVGRARRRAERRPSSRRARCRSSQGSLPQRRPSLPA
jgi:hypothetical protein